MADRIADSTSLPELTLRGLVLGALITVLFTASNVYLGLKVGLTFASSIPAAVISMAVLRVCRGANILENNMVQTQASAAGTLSSIIFIVPGLVMIGQWHGFPFWPCAAICAIGGVLGVMYTIPLRRAMVVESDLPYPEGRAAAEILRVGAAEAVQPGEPGVRDIALGGLVAAGFSLASSGFKLLGEEASWWLQLGGPVLRLGTSFSLALLGAGWLVGLTAGLAMLLGVVIAWGVAVPVLTLLHPIPPGGDIAAAATGLWRQNVRFIGAGTIAVGAIWALIQLLGPVLRGVRGSLSALKEIRAGRGHAIPRRERDIPIHWVGATCLGLALPMAAVLAWFIRDAAPTLDTATLVGLTATGVVFVLLFGFAIAAACGYMAGLVGSTNSPISGIGILGITLVSLMLLGLFGGAHGLLAQAGGVPLAMAVAIFVTSFIIAVAAVANDNLQDLKTGWLVGATPWKQQAALVAGVAVGALVIPPILELLYTAYGFPGALPRPDMNPDAALAAPQATLMSAIAVGIFSRQLSWSMILIGIALGLALLLVDGLLQRSRTAARVPVLAVGIGIYLPPTVTVAIAIGAVLGAIAEELMRRRGTLRQDSAAGEEPSRRRGVLFASGLIVGESLVGVLLAGMIGITGRQSPIALVDAQFAPTATWLGLAAFVTVCIFFYRYVTNPRHR